LKKKKCNFLLTNNLSLGLLEDHCDIEKFKLSFPLFKDCMLIAFPLTLTNECKHVMNPYCVNKSKSCFLQVQAIPLERPHNVHNLKLTT